MCPLALICSLCHPDPILFASHLDYFNILCNNLTGFSASNCSASIYHAQYFHTNILNPSISCIILWSCSGFSLPALKVLFPLLVTHLICSSLYQSTPLFLSPTYLSVLVHINTCPRQLMQQTCNTNITNTTNACLSLFLFLSFLMLLSFTRCLSSILPCKSCWDNRYELGLSQVTLSLSPLW